MIDIRRTDEFKAWLNRLKDQTAKGLIVSRIQRVAKGNFGDTGSVGEGVSELRIHFGPGYRLYYTQRSGSIVILLCGGAKGTQSRDIKDAQALAKDLDI